MDLQKTRLRPLRKEDSEILYRWAVDRDLVTQSRNYRPISNVEHQLWFEGATRASDHTYMFMIEDVCAQHPIGTCQLTGINWIYRSAELRIRIGDGEFQGKGHGENAIKILLHFAFNDLNLNRVSLSVFKTNERAIRVYTKVGFLEEGILRNAAYIDGKYVDIILMAILRPMEYL